MGGPQKEPAKRVRRSSSKSTRTRLADVAREAGVSIATASRALSGAAGVSLEQRQRILAIAEQLDYEHNPIGRSLRSGKTNLIGVWVESIANNSSRSFLNSPVSCPYGPCSSTFRTMSWTSSGTPASRRQRSVKMLWLTWNPVALQVNHTNGFDGKPITVNGTGW